VKNVLLDTSTYSHFARAGHYGLLESVFKDRLHVLSLAVSEAERGTLKYPELGALSTSVADGKTIVINELTDEEYDIMAALPNKFSMTDKACIAVAKERAMVIASDDEDLLIEARARDIEAYETEDVLETAAKTIGADRARAVLADMVKTGANKGFRELKV